MEVPNLYVFVSLNAPRQIYVSIGLDFKIILLLHYFVTVIFVCMSVYDISTIDISYTDVSTL